MSKPVIVTSEDGYLLRVGKESSELVPFGQPLEVELGGERWLALIDLPEGSDEASETESTLEYWLYKVEPMLDADIEFEEDDDEDSEDEVEVTVPGGDEDEDDGDDED